VKILEPERSFWAAQLLDQSVDPSGPEMMHALDFKYPCGLTGHEINEKPLNFCEVCKIDTNLCIDYYANNDRIFKGMPERPITFEQYLKYRGK
jgi:hypothetical protein